MARLVSFISDEKLVAAVKLVVDKTHSAIIKSEEKLDKNRLDAFSAVFDSLINGLDYPAWLAKEKNRQIQKTMQNAIGHFHQKVIGGIDGWEDLGVGSSADVRNQEKKIIAEVKNKFNTCRGADLIEIYDELDRALVLPEHEGYKAYFVTVIGKKRDYCENFCPTDRSKKGQHRPSNERIKEISGVLFYDLASGVKDSLFTLLKAVPVVLEREFKFKTDSFKSEEVLRGIFDRTYKCKGAADTDEPENDA